MGRLIDPDKELKLYETSFSGPIRLKIASLIKPNDLLVFLIVIAHIRMKGEGKSVPRSWFARFGVSDWSRKRALKSLHDDEFITLERDGPGRAWRIWLACRPWPDDKD